MEVGRNRVIPKRSALDAGEDLIRNIHGVAEVAELNGDELGYLLKRVAKIKRIE